MPTIHLTTPDVDAIPPVLFDQELGMFTRFEEVATDFLNSQSSHFGSPPMVMTCKFVDEKKNGSYHACAMQRSASEHYSVLIPVTLLGVLYWLGRSLHSIPFLQMWSRYNSSGTIVQTQLIDKVLQSELSGSQRLEIIAQLNRELPYQDANDPSARGFVSLVLKFIAGHEFAHIFQWHLHLRSQLEENGNCQLSEVDWLHGAEFTADRFSLDNLIRPIGGSVTVNQVTGLLWSLGVFFAGIHVREKRSGSGQYPPAALRYALLCQSIQESDEQLVQEVWEGLIQNFTELADVYKSEVLEQYSLFVKEVQAVPQFEIVRCQQILNSIRQASSDVFRDRPAQLTPIHYVRIKMS